MKMINGVKFDIIETDDEIIFMDENGETLTWDLNDHNKILVDDMIATITGSK